MVSVDSIIESADELGSLPDLYYRLEEAIEDPNSSFEHIGDIISEDAALTARLLRLSNSAFYNFPGEVATIQRAMSIIGTSELKELVLATTVIDLFSNLKITGISMKDFWAHSLSIAIAARVIATYRRERKVEKIYISGLLCNLGLLVLLYQFPEEMNKVFEYVANNAVFLSDAERKVLGFTHAEVGSRLLNHWQLPEVYQIVTMNFIEPKVDNDYGSICSIVHVSNIIAKAMQIGYCGEPHVPTISPDAWKILDLTTDILPNLIQHVDEQYEASQAIFVGGAN